MARSASAAQPGSAAGSPRWKDGMPPYIRMEEAPSKRPRTPRPLILRTFATTPLMMRVIFKKLEDEEKGPAVSVIRFRRVLRRYIDTFDPRMQFDVDAFGNRQGYLKMTWLDVRHAIDDDLLPRLPLSWAQSVFLTMDDFSSSWSSFVYHVILSIAVVVNITAITVRSLRLEHDLALGLKMAGEFTVHIFIFDYFMKAICVTSCPIMLFDEAWVIDAITSGSRMPTLQSTRISRFWHWATMPTNIIDLLSIVPAVIAMVAFTVHVPLSALRMLRLLRGVRILRVFRAVSQWISTLQVLGEAFYSSLGAIMVLVLYIGLFSMVAGAILYQQEHQVNDDWSDVPRAMRGVAEIFVGKSFSVSSTILGALVLASVGMFKSIIFLLPIDQLKCATKKAQDRVDTLSRLRREVDSEGSWNIDWAHDLSCASVRAFVHLEGAAEGCPPAIATMNVPLHEATTVDAWLQVPLHGGPQRIFHPRPELAFRVIWRPDANTSPALPKGQLNVAVQMGKHFAGFPSSRWRVELEAPEKLYGHGAQTTWMSPPSLTGAPSPEWPPQAVATFNIAWEAKDMASHMSESNFQQQVIHLLQEQAKKISALEEEVKQLRLSSVH